MGCLKSERRKSHGSTAEPEEGFLNLCQFLRKALVIL